MIWIATVMFVSVALYLILKRKDVARYQSFFWGATTSAGCVVTQGIFFLLLAALFLVAYKFGMIGGR